MLKENRKQLIFASVLILLPMVLGILLWNQLPNTMATHFGINNEPNGFTSKVFTVFGIPSVMLALYWFAIWLTAHDPKNRNISPKLFHVLIWIIPFINLFVFGIIYPQNLGYTLDVSTYALLFLAIVFIAIGNYMPKARQNYSIGVRTRWTLNDEDNWNQTNRLAGYLYIGVGIVVLISVFLGWRKIEFLLVLILIASFIPAMYSYYLSTKK